MESLASEKGPLLPVVQRHQRKKIPYCCVQSKAARLILLWNFSVLLAYNMFYNINIFGLYIGYLILLPLPPFTFIAVLSPVAGLLTDIRFSRAKVVVYNSYVIIVKLIISLIVLASLFTFLHYYHHVEYTYIQKTIDIVLISILFIMVIVYVVFIINAIQFGMDQLHDSTTEDSILYIHWYVWTYYICSLISQISWNFLLYDRYFYNYDEIVRISGYCLTSLTCIIILLLLTVSLCVVHYRKVWFLLEPAGVNPYKMVYRVVKFAYQHKVPLRRSAFTYCDEESPTRLDVGKHKYGGPFTTKQVEDVKAFWGILKVIITIGPAFLLLTVMQSLLPLFAKHGNTFRNTTARQEIHLEGITRHILISNGLLSPLLVVICIPLYLCWIRPHITYYIPGMLKRIQIALVVMVLSLICTFVMDVVVHVSNTEYANCLFGNLTKLTDVNVNKFVEANDIPSSPPLYQNVYFFTTQHVLSALADMLFDIAILEFICSQSPYSMKGLLLGIFFSIRSLFQGIAVVSIVPFGTVRKIQSLSCGSGFYAMYIVIGLLEFVVFSCVSKRYKYRNVNEPSNEYRYAEEYYSNIQ